MMKPLSEIAWIEIVEDDREQILTGFSDLECPELSRKVWD
jgi:hypothetical protein